MCNPTLVVAGLSAGLAYQQSMAAQKAQRDAQIRQNEIAKNNLENKRTNNALKLRKTNKSRLEKLKIKTDELRRRKSKFLASDTGYTGNTYEFLLGNYLDVEGQATATTFGNIENDKFQYNLNYSYLNDAYDAQTTFVTTPDARTTGLAAGLNFAGSYYNYKAQQNANNVNNDPYSYNVTDSDTYAQTDFDDYG